MLLDVAVLRSLNIRVVLVHGAAAQIERSARRAGRRRLRPRRHRRHRRRDAGAGADRRQPPDARDPRGAVGQRPARRTHQRHRRASRGHPPGRRSSVHRQGRARGHGAAADAAGPGIVPVVPPLGFDGDGKTYRVNSDAVAVEVAEALRAVKLIYLTTPGRPVVQRRADPPDAASATSTRSCRQDRGDFAARELVQGAARGRGLPGRRPRVHIINGRVDEGLLGRGVLQRRHRHADPRQRVPADPRRARRRTSARSRG